MSAICLSALSYQTSDGKQLFRSLDLTVGSGLTGLVGRNGVGKSTLLRLIAGIVQPSAGAITANGRIAMLDQSGIGNQRTIAACFGAEEAVARLARIENGMTSGDDIALADWTLQPRIHDALRQLGLEAMPLDRHPATLSGGEQHRLALAALVFNPPDILLLDEPTNHLDAEGRAVLATVLKGWKGQVIMASHDRNLLELADRIIELTTAHATVYGGGWSFYHSRKTAALLQAEQRLAEAERDAKQTRLHNQRQQEKQRKRAAHGHKNRDKAGVSKMQIDIWKDSADRTTARLLHSAARKTMAAQSQLSDARNNLDILDKPRFAIASTGLMTHQPVLILRDVTGGPDAEYPIIRNLDHAISGPQRVAIGGPNGSGKTTLLRLITGDLPASRGSIQRPDAIAMLDQHLSLLGGTDTALENVRHHNPDMTQNEAHAALARFLFRADEAHHPVHSMSGGEKMRLALCCMLGNPKPPTLLLLDEPTNHLDMEAVAALEAALSAYDGAMLVISHDQAFLGNLGITHHVTLPLTVF